MSVPTVLQEPITLYNALDRFALLERELNEMEVLMDDLKDCAHPWIFDLVLNLLMIRTSVNGMRSSINRDKLKSINSAQLRALSDLEMNTYLFRDTVEKAHADQLGSR